MRSLSGVVDFCCPSCVRWGRGDVMEQQEIIEVDYGIIKGGSSLLPDIFNIEAGVERAIRRRVAAAWSVARKNRASGENRYSTKEQREGI